MIKVHFFDWDSDNLDVEHEMGIPYDVADFLMEHVSGIWLEATDNQFDLENNWIFWFCAEDESEAIRMINDMLSSMVKPDSSMDFTVSAESW